MHQRYFHSLCGIILRLQKEVIGSGLENTFKNHEKEHSGHDENNFFFYSIFYFTTFFNPLFFAFLQQFTAGESLRVAGDSAGCQRIPTTLVKGIIHEDVEGCCLAFLVDGGSSLLIGCFLLLEVFWGLFSNSSMCI